MPVRVYKRTSPGRRNSSANLNTEVTRHKPEKSLLTSVTQHAGRNHHGIITQQGRGGGAKRRYRRIDFRRDKLDIAGTVLGIEYDPNRTCHIALVEYEDGERRYILAPRELADGDTFTAVDDSSQTLYGPRSLPIRDLSLSDAQAEGLAQWVVYRFAVPHMWLDNLSMNGRAGSVLASMLARSVGDRVTFVNTPPGTGTAEVTGHIERVSHSVGRGTWMVEVDVTPYHGAGPWLTLDDASLGLLGATAANKIAP
jgi:hypothetical protein